jgi:hypothetical protein
MDMYIHTVDVRLLDIGRGAWGFVVVLGVRLVVSAASIMIVMDGMCYKLVHGTRLCSIWYIIHSIYHMVLP